MNNTVKKLQNILIKKKRLDFKIILDLILFRRLDSILMLDLTW